jgi:MSHA biogenesis protein MshJ
MEQWARLAERFDTMSLRERVLVAVGVIVVTVYMSYFLLVDPLLAARVRLEQAIMQERTMLKAVDTVIVPTPGPADNEDAVRRAYQDALAKQIDEIKQSLKGRQKGLVPPDQMARLLEGMIVQVRGVELASLRKLPVQRMQTEGKPAATPGAAGTPRAGQQKPAAEPAGGGVYQHGYEITIQGSYAGLHDYLARLEKLPWRMFWGRLSLNAAQHPRIIITLTVHTLSLDRIWLTI